MTGPRSVRLEKGEVYVEVAQQRDELRLLKREHKAERMQQRFERHQRPDDNSDK